MKACPCCGKISAMKELYSMYYVECKCGLKTKRYETPEEAEKIWNRRVENQIMMFDEKDLTK